MSWEFTRCHFKLVSCVRENRLSFSFLLLCFSAWKLVLVFFKGEPQGLLLHLQSYSDMNMFTWPLRSEQ